MSDLIAFPNATEHLGLPLLIPGQAQKEFFVNQALAILDALQARVVTASQPAPPASAAEGECFRVTAGATQAWEGGAERIAVRISDDWHLIAPRQGMTVLDQTARQILVFQDGWQSADPTPPPAGGSTIDIQAREAIAALIQSLQAIGVLSAPVP